MIIYVFKTGDGDATGPEWVFILMTKVMSACRDSCH